MASSEDQKLHSYPWYISDWRESETRIALTISERGLYRELLDHCYSEGSLPNDERTLAMIAAVAPVEFRKSWRRVSSLFEEHSGRLYHWKVTEIRNGLLRWHRGRAEAGKRGGLAKARTKQLDSTANSSASDEPQAKLYPSSTTTSTTTSYTVAPPAPLPIAFDPQTHFERLYRCHLGAARRRDCLDEYLGIVGQRDEAACERIQVSAEKWNAYWTASSRSPTGLLNWLRNGDWESEPPAVVQRTNGARSQFAEVLAAGGDEWTPEQLAEMKRMRGGSW